MSVFHFFLMLLVVIVWGFNFVSVEVALQGMKPITLCFVRFFLLCFPAIFFVKRPSTAFGIIIGYAFFLFVLQFSLLFAGMHAGVSAGLTSILLQFQMFFTVLFAVLFLKEKPHIWQIVGGVVAFAGIAVIGFNIGGHGSFLGFALILTAAASWGFGNLFAKKLGKINMISMLIWASLISWPPLLIMALFFEGPESMLADFNALSWKTTAAILYIVLGSTLLGYGLWSWLLSRYPVTTIVPFTVLVPVFGMLSSVLVLGESLDSWKLTAGLLIIGGFCINLWMPQQSGRQQIR